MTSKDQVRAVVNYQKKKKRPHYFTCGKKGPLSKDCPHKKDKAKDKDKASTKI